MTAPTPQRMTPSEALVETLVANGVTEVFGIVGSAYMDALDIFPAAGIRFIPVAHEQGAAHMADGYARASGRHGVCIAQNGPGITNFVTAIAAAYWAHSPVVFITPETGSMTMGLGGFQETEQLPIFSKITKYQGHVNNPKRMAEIAARCFDRAMLELGPTQLNIPRDYFYGDIQATISPPLRIGRGPGDTAALDQAAELLAQAKFPVIVAGGGVITSGGTAEAIALAERLHAPVANSYLHNDSFPASHPLWCGPLGYQGSKAAMKLIAQADVVLALGTRLGPFGTLPQYGMEYWPAGAKIIQVDVDPRVLGLVKSISVGINGDARAAAAALIARLEGRELACAGQPGRAQSQDRGREGRLGARARRVDPRDRPVLAGGREGLEADAPAPDAARAREGDAAARDGLDRHRQHLLGVELVPAVRRAALDVRGDELRQLRLCVPGRLRRQGGCAGPAGHRLCRRRRVGHQPERAAHLRAREDRRDRDRVQQRPVGCREEEPRGLLFASLPGSEPRQPELGEPSRRPSAARASRSTSCRRSARRCRRRCGPRPRASAP